MTCAAVRLSIERADADIVEQGRYVAGLGIMGFRDRVPEVEPHDGGDGHERADDFFPCSAVRDG
jgi:hypothetical protein